MKVLRLINYQSCQAKGAFDVIFKSDNFWPLSRVNGRIINELYVNL
jgi:hypothetical protein